MANWWLKLRMDEALPESDLSQLVSMHRNVDQRRLQVAFSSKYIYTCLHHSIIPAPPNQLRWLLPMC
jgi:hypothetical protein